MDLLLPTLPRIRLPETQPVGLSKSRDKTQPCRRWSLHLPTAIINGNQQIVEVMQHAMCDGGEKWWSLLQTVQGSVQKLDVERFSCTRAK